jgi:rRNA maturation endonuclease Nob1
MHTVHFAACKTCGKIYSKILNSRDYCDECGSSLLHRCPQCGKNIQSMDEEICKECGFNYFADGTC